jgi:hypothetical protein
MEIGMKKHDKTRRPANAKLNEAIVRELRADKAAGLTVKARSEKYRIPMGTISSVDSGLSWWWVK